MHLVNLWAQAPAAVPTDTFAVARIALRRFFAGATLSAPDGMPSFTPIWALASALLLLTAIVLVVQGPRSIGQFFDAPGHVRLLSAALTRFQRGARVLAALLGSAVLAWTVWQSRSYASPERLEELGAALQRKSVTEFAFEQSLLAAICPLRDIAGLAGNLVLLLGASLLVFKAATDRYGTDTGKLDSFSGPPPRWTTLAWTATWLFALYRLACHIWRPDGLPLGRLPWIEVFLVPFFALVSDSLILAWVLGELRRALSDSSSIPLSQSVNEAIANIPAAMLACLLVFPARYLAYTAWLAVGCVPQSAVAPTLAIARILFDWGLAWAQCASFAFIAVVGAAAWARERGHVPSLALRTLRAEGGRLLAVTLGCAAVIASGVFVAYAALLSLPAQPWVLAAADSYSHYFTLPIGLLFAATLIELTGRATAAIDIGENQSVAQDESEARPHDFVLSP